MAKEVNWHEFHRRIKEKRISLFSALDVQRLFGTSKVAADFLLFRYAKKGFITRVKRGLYAFPDALPPDPYLANKLYEPSYVSLMSALSYHRVIPEMVYEVTSVTSKATRRFEKLGKVFSYRHVRQGAFTGYATAKQGGLSFRIADPEKAFVDLAYFRVLDDLKPLSRFDKEKLHPQKALRYATLYNDKRLEGIVKKTLQ